MTVWLFSFHFLLWIAEFWMFSKDSELINDKFLMSLYLFIIFPINRPLLGICIFYHPLSIIHEKWNIVSEIFLSYLFFHFPQSKVTKKWWKLMNTRKWSWILGFHSQIWVFQKIRTIDARIPFILGGYVGAKYDSDVNTTMMQQNGSCHRSIFMPTEHSNWSKFST